MTSILQAIYDERNTSRYQLEVGMYLGNQILGVENSINECLKIADVFSDDAELQEDCAQRVDKLWQDKNDLIDKLYDLGWFPLSSDYGTIGIVRMNLSVKLDVDEDFELF